MYSHTLAPRKTPKKFNQISNPATTSRCLARPQFPFLAIPRDLNTHTQKKGSSPKRDSSLLRPLCGPCFCIPLSIGFLARSSRGFCLGLRLRFHTCFGPSFRWLGSTRAIRFATALRRFFRQERPAQMHNNVQERFDSVWATIGLFL